MQKVLKQLNEVLSKPDWYDTCVEFNDCSICPYGEQVGQYFKCTVDKENKVEIDFSLR